MTAAAADRRQRTEYWKNADFVFASGDIGYKGTRAFLDPSTGKIGVVPTPGFISIGILNDTVDASSADKSVSVDLEEGIWISWFANATSTDAVASTDVGKLGYHPDDSTVAITPAGHVLAGRIWKVDSVKGVAVQKLDTAADLPTGGLPTVGTYTSNDFAPADIVNGGVYDVPTTGAASTITLPAASADGTVAYFAADGTKNAHTVQYRDATGPTNLTTALTASKRHLVVVAKRGGKWFANAYVSP
jgi:hypothetical protein